MSREKLPVTRAIAREEHEPQPAIEREFRADDQFQGSLAAPSFFTAECARTTPASEHSSVMASAV